MFAVKVEYEVFPDYERENKNRIQDFLKAIEELDKTRFRYTVYQDQEITYLGIQRRHLLS